MKAQTKKLLIALAVAIVALVANEYYIKMRVADYKPQKKVLLVRTIKAIPAGTPLRRELIKEFAVDERFAPKTALKFTEFEQYQGQPLGISVADKDYVLSNYFAESQIAANKLSDKVAGGENFRAVTIPVDNVDSLSGSIVNSDRIDILFTFTVPGVGSKMSLPLLQDVQVLATGGYSQQEEELGKNRGRVGRYNTLTLLLPAHDALRLSYARQVGKIDIILRHSKDKSRPSMKPIANVLDLLGAEDKEMVASLQHTLQSSAVDREKLRAELRDLLGTSQKAAPTAGQGK